MCSFAGVFGWFERKAQNYILAEGESRGGGERGGGEKNLAGLRKIG